MNLMSNPMWYFLCSYLNSCHAEQSSSHLTFFPLWPFKLPSLISIASLGSGKMWGRGERWQAFVRHEKDLPPTRILAIYICFCPSFSFVTKIRGDADSQSSESAILGQICPGKILSLLMKNLISDFNHTSGRSKLRLPQQPYNKALCNAVSETHILIKNCLIFLAAFHPPPDSILSELSSKWGEGQEPCWQR